MLHKEGKTIEQADEYLVDSTELSVVDKYELDELIKKYQLNDELLERLIESKNDMSDENFAQAMADYAEINSEINLTIHIVAGLGDNKLWLITAYEPDQDKWSEDFKTRKEQV